ncbi:uncharacterized protein EURHEDRAFT_417553 [Aspergillus ruber CBS 135680]|uniref:Uncharacterized protein n=1 Tax=Aspergillus ruber (strain CBS 135680) TaxID=1388766 RepID=A0A017S0F0_ASPRC|nr:uncharacterized protein EURHEDRAFT_417553 [Aspergillus ruber CBS 135680]EYE90326.1 hypothetical protein EURHEDRAFT_417553 [Aspergillus ruber CBS 135680]
MDELPKTKSREIEYLYFDLDIPLLTSIITSLPGPGQSSPLKPPDLKKYGSPFLWPKWCKPIMI